MTVDMWMCPGNLWHFTAFSSFQAWMKTTHSFWVIPGQWLNTCSIRAGYILRNLLKTSQLSNSAAVSQIRYFVYDALCSMRCFLFQQKWTNVKKKDSRLKAIFVQKTNAFSAELEGEEPAGKQSVIWLLNGVDLCTDYKNLPGCSVFNLNICSGYSKNV